MTPRAALTWPDLGLVALGGAAGTAGRAALLLVESDAWQAVAIPTVNIAGSFALGLVTGFAVRLAHPGRARVTRLLLGTGVLGGFTTYSSFSVLAVTGVSPWLTAATAVAGPVAAWLGLGLAAVLRRGRRG